MKAGHRIQAPCERVLSALVLQSCVHSELCHRHWLHSSSQLIHSVSLQHWYPVTPVADTLHVRISVKGHATTTFILAECVAHHCDGLHGRLKLLILHQHAAIRSQNDTWKSAHITSALPMSTAHQLGDSQLTDSRVAVCDASQRQCLDFETQSSICLFPRCAIF